MFKIFLPESIEEFITKGTELLVEGDSAQAEEITAFDKAIAEGTVRLVQDWQDDELKLTSGEKYRVIVGSKITQSNEEIISQLGKITLISTINELFGNESLFKVKRPQPTKESVLEMFKENNTIQDDDKLETDLGHRLTNELIEEGKLVAGPWFKCNGCDKKHRIVCSDVEELHRCMKEIEVQVPGSSTATH